MVFVLGLYRKIEPKVGYWCSSEPPEDVKPINSFSFMAKILLFPPGFGTPFEISVVSVDILSLSKSLSLLHEADIKMIVPARQLLPNILFS